MSYLLIMRRSIEIKAKAMMPREGYFFIRNQHSQLKLIKNIAFIIKSLISILLIFSVNIAY